MSHFVYKSVKVEIAPYLASVLKAEQITRFQPFVNWLSRLQDSLKSTAVKGGATNTEATYYEIKKIDIQSADFFGPEKRKLGFLKLKATVEDDQGSTLPGIVLLRGQSVAILVLLYPSVYPGANRSEDFNDDNAYVVLTVQPRIPGGSMKMSEIPAGMFDSTDKADGGVLKFTAQRELKEECGIEIKSHEMKSLYTENGGIFMSPGGCDEQIQLFYCRKLVAEKDMQELEGKFGGAADELQERITLRIVPLKDLMKATQDAKTICAYSIYRDLREV
ncbi:hypothetical protein V1511DRAFT_510110 [Dipodascopsis uninucleata]